MIELKKMTEEEFAAYLAVAVPNYAAEKRRGEGLSAEDADRVARESFAGLLPQGLASPDQHLFTVVEKSTGNGVGTLWLAKQKAGSDHRAYIYDIVLDPAVRGRGYGKALMARLEEEVRGMGLSAIALHVFGHNQVAIQLYEKSGFHTTNRIMKKELP